MSLHRFMRIAPALGLMAALGACGSLNPFGGSSDTAPSDRALAAREQAAALEKQRLEDERGGNSTIWSLFNNRTDPNTTVAVNKYIWNAALDVLNFLPVETVDPFTGVIVTGYGTPPGGGRAYRATVYVQDPALDARSLKVALQSSGGGSVSRDTAKAVEDAILTRARQLRARDGKL